MSINRYNLSKFNHIENIDVKGKTVLMRIDINTPINPETGSFLNDFRLKSNAGSITELLERGCKLVLLAHQGDPGDTYSFTSLSDHTEKLSEICNREIKFRGDLFGDSTVTEIKSLAPGDCLLLENVRFYSEEKLDRSPSEHAKNHLVRTLSRITDIYVNNAFSVVHRNHSSITGFPFVMPAYAGRLMMQEMSAFSKLLEATERPTVLVIGGYKIGPKLKMLERATHMFDKILTGGLIANLFLLASGQNVGRVNLNLLEKAGALEYLSVAKKILNEHQSKLEIPEDLVMRGSKIMDIGSKTIERYKGIISDAKQILVNGPMGFIETPLYAKGTEELASAIARCTAHKIVCGGHTPVVFENMGLSEKIDHISTGGGAALLFIGGCELPGLSALEKNLLSLSGGEVYGESQKTAGMF